MRNGLGVQAVREKIAQAFRSVHQDGRTREDVQADRELTASLGQSHIRKPDTADVKMEISYTLKAETAFQTKAETLTKVALRTPAVKQAARHRSTLTPRTWYVGSIDEPGPSAEELIRDALRGLEEEQ